VVPKTSQVCRRDRHRARDNIVDARCAFGLSHQAASLGRTGYVAHRYSLPYPTVACGRCLTGWYRWKQCMSLCSDRLAPFRALYLREALRSADQLVREADEAECLGAPTSGRVTAQSSRYEKRFWFRQHHAPRGSIGRCAAGNPLRELLIFSRS
jgi:hypothetical protein